jgi:hypothetical protein
MLRSRTLIPLVSAVLASAAFAAPAGANTYCVNTPSCVSAGGVDSGSDGAALAAALSTAQANAGADRVEIGPGSYSNAGGFAYNGQATNPIEIVGAGSDKTMLTNTTTGTTLFLNAPNSSVTALGVVTAPASNAVGVSLAATQSMGSDLAVSDQAGTTSGRGAVVTAGSTLEHATVTSTAGHFLYGVAGLGTLRDSTVSGGIYGVLGITGVHRVTIAGALGTGLINTGQLSSKFDQVLIRVPTGASGLTVGTSASIDSVTTADHVTIVGAGDASSLGASARSTSGGPPHNAKLILRSSIVRGVGHDLSRTAANGAADLEVDHSDFDPATTLEDIQPGGSGALVDNGGNVNVDPQFASTSDFHLLAGSPVIDQGAAAVQAGESSTDLDGAARLFGAATDMGAFEYEPPPPPPPPSPGSTESSSGTSESGTTAPAGEDPAAQPPVAAPDLPQVPPPGSPSFSLGRTITVRRPSTGSLKFTCKAAGPCALTSKLTSGSTVIARARGSIAEGHAAQVTVRLTRAGRKLLAHRPKLRVKLTGTVTNPGGGHAAVATGATVKVSVTG